MKINRIALFFIILIVGIVAVEYKKSKVREARSETVESVLSLLVSQGTPVQVLKASVKPFPITKLVTLENCGSSKLCSSVSRLDRLQFEVGQKVSSLEGDKVIGQVVSVSQVQNVRSGMYSVTIAVSDSKIVGQLLKESPQLVAEVTVKNLEATISLPKSAVLIESEGSFVWRVEGDDKIEKVKVETGKETFNSVQVLSGVSAGDQIVVRGQHQVPKYDKFRIVKDPNS